MPVIPSQIVAVQVYRRGATVTRHAVIDVDAAGLPPSIEVAGLPLSLLDPSVKVRVLHDQPSSSSSSSSSPAAASVRVGLFVRGAGERTLAPEQREVDAVVDELRSKRELARLIDNETGLLAGMPIPDRPQPQAHRAPPPAPLAMRAALESFVDEAAQARRRQRRTMLHEVQDLEERLRQMQERIAASSSSSAVQLAELSKSATIELRAGEGPAPSRVVVELSYVVPGARWTPAYQVKLQRDGTRAVVQLRAHVAQKSGEDWRGVRLKLSTAQPLRFTELPELSSVRIGKQQPAAKVKGFRPPPRGGEVLFRDFDRDRSRVQAAVPAPRPWQRPALDAAGADLVVPVVVTAPPRALAPRKLAAASTPTRLSRLGEALVRAGMVSAQQVQWAQEAQRHAGGGVTQHLVQLGYLDERALTVFYAREYNATIINLVGFRFDAAVLRLVPAEVVHKHRMIPVSLAGNTLTVVMAEPGNVFAIDDVRFLTGYAVEVAVAVESALQHAITHHYGSAHSHTNYGMMGDLGASDLLGADETDGAERSAMASVDDDADHATREGKVWDVGEAAADLDLDSALAEDDEFLGDEQTAPAPPPPPIRERRAESKPMPPKGGNEKGTRRPDADDAVSQSLLFPLLHLPSATDASRGKLVPVDVGAAYARSLQRSGRPVPFDVLAAVHAAELDARSAGSSPPPQTVDLEGIHSVYDYAYEADGVVDVEGDGGFHSVALGEREGEAVVRYIAVPREELSVSRTAWIQNPLPAPLLSGPAEVYVGGDYVLTTVLPTVPMNGEVKLGLGVEQAIKIARNARFAETRGQGVVAMAELVHDIDIDVVNHLGRVIDIEVRDRVPVPAAGAEVQVDEPPVEGPQWEPWNQAGSGDVVVGGRRWQLQVAAGAALTLHARYVLKLFSNAEVTGGNRRER